MSKKSKKKYKRQQNRRNEPEFRNIENPRQFLKSIGIDGYYSGNLDRTDKFLKKHMGQTVADEFWQKLEKSGRAHLYYCFSNLVLAKLWYGNHIAETSRVAKALKDVIAPPSSKILDIGGGPGVIAFWLTNLWTDCEVTVADQFSTTGNAWAQEINATRVNFIDDLLPHLNKVGTEAYDLAIMSRVLSYVAHMDFSNGSLAYGIEQFITTDPGQQLLRDVSQIAETIQRILKPDGQAVIVDLWNDSNLYLTAMAFEKNGLSINLDLFTPENMSNDYSALILSKKKDSNVIANRPLGLSTILNFSSNGPTSLTGLSAESMRKCFDGGTLHSKLEYSKRNTHIHALNEVIEKEGITLWYRTVTDGQRGAWLYPSILTPTILERLLDLENDILADKDIIVTKSTET